MKNPKKFQEQTGLDTFRTASNSNDKDAKTEWLKQSINERLFYSLGKDKYTATDWDRYESVAYAVRDRLIERWLQTQQKYYNDDVKRVYYLSMEFLIGRTLGNSILNLDIEEETKNALKELGYSLEDLIEKEWDAGLGNGGLGRLAACFLDSMATLAIPAYGYGIRYEYGIFYQNIADGYQVETSDNWLDYGNPWEIPRTEDTFPVRFYGKVKQYTDNFGKQHFEWVDSEEVQAIPYDIPVPGYQNEIVNTMRLWSAKAGKEFDLTDFNTGDYYGAVEQKNQSELISKVLYPNDEKIEGRELRLKQEYFFVSATLQDAIRRYKKHRNTFDDFADKVAFQLNDTHPAIAVPELMRMFLDEEHLSWDKAWDITTKVFSYTNHTLLPEALEKWPLDLFSRVLPRHILLIYEINRRFLERVAFFFPGDFERQARMSLIEEGSLRYVRMAHLAIVGSHSVNGVAAMHSELVKNVLFKDFYQMCPQKFNNKTNGITPRRWIQLSNPSLSQIITDKIGEAWMTDLTKLKELEKYAEDKEFHKLWRASKKENKKQLAKYIYQKNGIQINVDSIFDVQIKRIHEYKRQLMNILYAISMYLYIIDNPKDEFIPRTIIIGGKAAPGYHAAKLIIKLIHSVGNIINNDPRVGDKLNIVFIRNYGVSIAEKIVPATDLSEQISTAGKEASGTGNMKFMLNGALTIGTLDGANVEMAEEVKSNNIFIFGNTIEEINELKKNGYNPKDYYNENTLLKRIIDMIYDGYFSPEQPDLFHSLIDTLMNHDPYFVFADFQSYHDRQIDVAECYKKPFEWTKKSILNTAASGKFSSDRTIKEYANEIWGLDIK